MADIDIGTVSGLIEFLKTMPQDAEVHIPYNSACSDKVCEAKLDVDGRVCLWSD